MPKFEIRVRMGTGQEKVIIEASNVHKARQMAEAQTGGKVLGSRQI
jgi:hypothetical protein|tara:strand:+ start:146 stop:283 length:138 start_codon:yes stop_codon:yes gene_type:complete